MALGEFKLFQMKSKKQREKEEREYAAWAFPFGDLQRENLTTLVKELKPKESPQICLASFLTCKELFDNVLEEAESYDAAVDKMINGIVSYGQLIKKDEMPFYLALVLADAKVDEKCEYPSADEIRASVQDITDLKIKSKFELFRKKK